MAAFRLAQYALRSSVWKRAVIFAALLVSCAGRSAFAQDCHPESPPKILVLRGIFEIFSLGMNDLARKLRCRGYDATSTSWSLALFVTDCSGDRPLIVIGHSLGGRMCGWTSRLLKSCGQRVPLVIVVDANLLMPIPSNVDECLNLYVTNELGIFHGSRVRAESPHTRVVNWDVSRGQPSMFQGGVNHFDIDATDWVHEIIIREIECRFPLSSATPESDEANLVRRADASMAHVVGHDEEDLFDAESRKNRRVQWQPTRPAWTEVTSAAKSTGRIERVAWQPTRPRVVNTQSRP